MHTAIVVSLGLLLAPAPGGASEPTLAQAIDRAALAAPRPENLRRERGQLRLYGERTDGVDTAGGRLACAKVVSIVLRQAGAKLPVQLGVAGVEHELRGWARVLDEEALQPGDVVVWTNRWRGNPGGACTGRGTCHVGIKTHAGYFHNDPLAGGPTFGGLGLLFYRFKVGFRPPAQ